MKYSEMEDALEIARQERDEAIRAYHHVVAALTEERDRNGQAEAEQLRELCLRYHRELDSLLCVFFSRDRLEIAEGRLQRGFVTMVWDGALDVLRRGNERGFPIQLLTERALRAPKERNRPLAPVDELPSSPRCDAAPPVNRPPSRV